MGTMSSPLSWAALLLALGSGLVTGGLFAFSSFIMHALGQTPQGASAMQSINIVIMRSSFIALFLALAPAGLTIVVLALLNWQSPASPWLLVGGLLYLVGVFGVTMLFNVPLNDRLAAAKPETLEAVWRTYLHAWSLWNTVRTVMGAASSLSFIVAFSKTV